VSNQLLNTKNIRKGAKGSFAVPKDFSPEGKRFAQSIVDNIQQLTGEKGSVLDKAVTFNDLVNAGIAKKQFVLTDGGSNFVIGPGDNQGVDTPTAPTGASAGGGFQNILISWDYPSYSGHSHTEIFVHDSDNFAQVEVSKGRLSPKFLGQTTASVFSHQVGNGANKYYWIRHVNQNDVAGPTQGTSGLNGTTAADIAAQMGLLSEQLQDLPGFTALNTLINNSAGTAATIIRSTSAPTTRTDNSALQANDIWIDTDDNNQLYIRNSSNNGWEEARDGTLVTLVNSINTTVGDANSGLVQSVATAQANIVTLTNENSAQATSITNLTSSVGSNTASVNTLTTANATTNDRAGASYVLQVNANGHIAGFVVQTSASSSGQTTSDVIFQADRFRVVGSSGSGVTTPFTVVTTPFTQNGETVAAGTYITNAFIQNGAITNAQIGDLQIDNAKVTSGLSAAKITTDQMNADRVKIDNLTLDTDGSGNLIIKNNGVVVNKLGSNSLGRVASVYVTGQAYTQQNFDLNNFKSTSPLHYFQTTDKFGFPVGNPTYMGADSDGFAQLTIFGSQIKETGNFVVHYFVDFHGSVSGSSVESTAALNITESTSSSSANNNTASSFLSVDNGKRSGSGSFHLTPLHRYFTVSLTAGRTYKFFLYAAGRNFGNQPGGGSPNVTGGISVHRLNRV